MYNQKVLARFKAPRNCGGLRGANGVGKVGGDGCGDIIKIYLLVNDDERIEEARFKTYGCVAAIAASDVACDIIKGMNLEEAQSVTNKQIFDELVDLPTNKLYCAPLAEEAIRAAIEDYYRRKEKERG